MLKSGRMSAGEISEKFDITAAAISRHLSVLKEADLIRDTREGKFIIYELNASVLEEILLFIHHLKGEPMEKLNFDTGLRTYRVGGGTLRFNPTDPNLYARFLDALDSLTQLEANLPRTSDGPGTIELLRTTDTQVKAILQGVFGPENDLTPVFGDLNLLAVGENGQRLLTNFMAALEPILTDGALRCARAEAEKLK